MSVKRFLLDFLRDLERRVPPPPRCHHAITFARYGDDARGWEDRLALHVNVDGTFFCFFLDEGDFRGEALTLAALVARMVEDRVVDVRAAGGGRDVTPPQEQGVEGKSAQHAWRRGRCGKGGTEDERS